MTGKNEMISYGFPEQEFNKEMGLSRTQTVSVAGAPMDKFRVTIANRKHGNHVTEFKAVSGLKRFGGCPVDYRRETCAECGYARLSGVIFDLTENECYEHVFSENQPSKTKGIAKGELF